EMKTKVTEEMKKTFRPEFLNRIDEMIVFHSLEKDHIQEIVKLMINQVKQRLKNLDITFSITPRAIEKVAEEGFDPEYGARPLRLATQDNVDYQLSERRLKADIKIGEEAKLGID